MQVTGILTIFQALSLQEEPDEREVTDGETLKKEVRYRPGICLEGLRNGNGDNYIIKSITMCIFIPDRTNVTVVRSRRIESTGQGAQMAEMKNAHKISIRKSEEGRVFQRRRRKVAAPNTRGRVSK
jgi:hypothetical protein